MRKILLVLLAIVGVASAAQEVKSVCPDSIICKYWREKEPDVRYYRYKSGMVAAVRPIKGGYSNVEVMRPKLKTIDFVKGYREITNVDSLLNAINNSYKAVK